MTELQALRAEAESLYEKGDLQGSLSKYRSLLGDDGDDPGLLNDIGTVCFALGRVEESARYYVSALELDEGCGEARQNLQRLCKAIGKTVDAVVHSARQQPGSSGRLEALLQQGRYSEAYELACRCTEREPDNAEAWNDAAVVAHELRKTAEAVGYIQQAVELAPRDLDIQQNLRRIEQAATERRDSFSLPGGSSRIVCGVQDRPIRVLFLEHGTPAAFLRNLLRAFEREDWLQTHYVRVGPKTDSVPFGWADVIWVEWASHLARHVTNSVAALREKKVVCRLHRYEAFGDIPHFINWDVVDRLVFVAEHIRETFSQRFPEVCVPQTVIHNGVDLDRFEVATGKRQARDVAFLAHLDYRKNLPLMLQIARELKERGTGRRIHVGGDWRAPEVREYFSYMRRQMGLEDTLVHDGYIEDVPAWLADKRFLLSTSMSEGHPYNILEGMAAGLKPVAHNFPGARELLPAASLFNTVSEAAQLLSGDPGDPDSYREYVKANFPRSKQLRQMRTLLEELVRNGDAAPAEVHRCTPSVEPPRREGGEALAETYDEEWYRDRLVYRLAYHEFARAVEEVFAPESLVDLGCGAGYIVEYFAGKIPVLGVEGSAEAFRVMCEKGRANSVCTDLTKPPLDRIRDFEFAVCVEVGEHIPQQKVQDFLKWFGWARRVLLTAAPPGQGGVNHVNEQPPDYWKELFSGAGFRFCPQETRRWRAAARAGTYACSWVVQNAMFFQRPQASQNA